MEGEKGGEVFQMEDVRRQWKGSGREYFEFLRVPDMSAGLYVLGKAAEDRQSPHGEDEICCVLSGKGRVRIDGRDDPVQAGSVVYVKAQVPHHLHSIEKQLQILVVFAPAFGTK